jgi:hypothetical protein
MGQAVLATAARMRRTRRYQQRSVVVSCSKLPYSIDLGKPRRRSQLQVTVAARMERQDGQRRIWTGVGCFSSRRCVSAHSSCRRMRRCPWPHAAPPVTAKAHPLPLLPPPAHSSCTTPGYGHADMTAAVSTSAAHQYGYVSRVIHWKDISALIALCAYDGARSVPTGDATALWTSRRASNGKTQGRPASLSAGFCPAPTDSPLHRSRGSYSYWYSSREVREVRGTL